MDFVWAGWISARVARSAVAIDLRQSRHRRFSKRSEYGRRHLDCRIRL